MKKIYSRPELTIHGSIETLTQVTGTATTKDVLFFNGSPSTVPVNTTGSADFNFIPPAPPSP